MEPIARATATTTAFKNFSYVVAAFVSLNPEAYTILAIFMVVDTATGIIRSGVVNGWRSVKSHVMTVGIMAKLLVILVPILLALAGHAIGIELTVVAKAALNVLILSELYSILANIQSIRLRKDIEEFDAVNFLLTKLRDFLEKNIKRPDQT